MRYLASAKRPVTYVIILNSACAGYKEIYKYFFRHVNFQYLIQPQHFGNESFMFFITLVILCPQDGLSLFLYL